METPREVFLEACKRLTEAFESDGYQWRSSLSELVKIEGDLRFSFRLQTSPRNALIPSSRKGLHLPQFLGKLPGGRHADALFLSLPRQLLEIERFGSVAIIPHVTISNSKFKTWRGQRLKQKDPNPTIASANLGYLMPEQRWLEVNLASEVSRTARTDGIAENLRNVGIPFQVRFKNPAESVRWLAVEESIPFFAFATLEYAFFSGGNVVASEVLLLLLSRFRRLGWIGSYE